MKSNQWTEKRLREVEADENKISLVPTLDDVMESRNFIRLLIEEYNRKRKPFKPSSQLRLKEL
jgi:hypothetical protein